MKRRASEQRRLLEIADEYREKGYDVVISPTESDAPSWLRGHEADLVARRGDDNVVVEVKSSNALRRGAALSELADIVERQPGWRLELVVTRPPTRKAEPRPLQAAGYANEYLPTARDLLARGLTQPAFVLAWMAFELAARHALESTGVDAHIGATPALLKTLLSLGLLVGTEEMRSLEKIWRLRNAVLHGYVGEVQLTPNHVEQLLSLTERLLAVEPDKA